MPFEDWSTEGKIMDAGEARYGWWGFGRMRTRITVHGKIHYSKNGCYSGHAHVEIFLAEVDVGKQASAASRSSVKRTAGRLRRHQGMEMRSAAMKHCGKKRRSMFFNKMG